MIGTGLRLTRAVTPAASPRPTTARMTPTGLRLSRCTARATGVAGGRTASRGTATGCARAGPPARPAFAAAGAVAATVGRDVLAGGFAWPLRLAAPTRTWSLATGGTAGLGVVARFSCGRTATRRVVCTGCLATSRFALGVWRVGWGTATVTGGDSSSTGSTGAGAGCGVVTTSLTGGGGAVTGGSDTGGGGGGGRTGGRAGNRLSGSTYPFGSAATRTPRWTCGCRVTASLLSPATPTSVPSLTVLPCSTLVAPSCSNVTA
jgi:hypothetical protein